MEEKLRKCIGKVYIRTNYDEDTYIGDGFGTLESFCLQHFKGNVTTEMLLKMIEGNPLHEEGTFDIIINLGDTHIPAFERIHTFSMPPGLLDIEYMPNPLTENRKEPEPPYKPKLHAYDKRRNYKKINYWKRIRSRLF